MLVKKRKVFVNCIELLLRYLMQEGYIHPNRSIVLLQEY